MKPSNLIGFFPYLSTSFYILFFILIEIKCSDFYLFRHSSPQIYSSEKGNTDGLLEGENDGFTVNTNTVNINANAAEEFDEDEADEALFAVRVRVLEIPGENFIRIFGRKVNGTDILGNAAPHVEFLGIPFAHPLINSLRFQRPTMKILTNDFKAIEEAPECPQLSTNGQAIGEEDCLFLNLFLPQMESPPRGGRVKMPVLVWFHGEGMERSADGKFGILSSGTSKELSPDVFLQNKIIVITAQYRLGSLGFLNTVNEDLNGNMGLFDQLLALEWTQRFVQFFGGDPKQITVMGHGSSAISLGLLATSELARGLYHRMILMGGSPLSPVSVDSNPKVTFAEIALQNSCPTFPTLRFVRCMQKRNLKNILQSDDRLTKGKHIGKARMPLPIIQKSADERFLPPVISTNPLTSISSGNFEPVPIILGVTSSEMSGFLPSISGTLRHELPKAIFTSNNVLKQFVRAVMSRGIHDPELMAELVSFEYFGGLNVTERQEQAKDLVEEFLTDFLFHIPALNLAKMWSRYAPVYFYVFDYVTSNEDAIRAKIADGVDLDSDPKAPPDFPDTLQAFHGSDLRLLQEGYKGSSEDREISLVIVDFWVNFIHKGSPLHAGINWPQFREDSKQYLYIGNEIEAASHFRKRQEIFWNGLVEEVNGRVCKTASSTGRNRNKHTSIFKNGQDTEIPTKGYFFLGNFSNESDSSSIFDL